MTPAIMDDFEELKTSVQEVISDVEISKELELDMEPLIRRCN